MQRAVDGGGEAQALRAGGGEAEDDGLAGRGGEGFAGVFGIADAVGDARERGIEIELAAVGGHVAGMLESDV